MDVTVFTKEQWIELFMKYETTCSTFAERLYEEIKEEDDPYMNEEIELLYNTAFYKREHNDEAAIFFEEYHKAYKKYHEKTEGQPDKEFYDDVDELYDFIIPNIEKFREYYPKLLKNEQYYLITVYFGSSDRAIEKNIYRLWYRELFGRDIDDDYYLYEINKCQNDKPQMSR